MMVLKKKEIIAASLVVLIGLAGYLNWSYQDTVNVRDGESYIETGKRLGEAQYVNSVEEVEENTDSENSSDTQTVSENVETVSGDSGYFEQARLDKEKSRSKTLEILNETAQNENFDAEIRKKAGDKIILQAQNIEYENQIESIAKSKGYNEICVYSDEDKATVTVRKEGFSDEDAIRLTELTADNMKISAKT